LMPMNPVSLNEGGNARVDFFVKLPLSSLEHGSKKVPLLLRYEGGERLLEVTLVGPDA